MSDVTLLSSDSVISSSRPLFFTATLQTIDLEVPPNHISDFEMMFYISKDRWISSDDLNLHYDPGMCVRMVIEKGILPGQPVTIRDCQGMLN